MSSRPRSRVALCRPLVCSLVLVALLCLVVLGCGDNAGGGYRVPAAATTTAGPTTRASRHGPAAPSSPTTGAQSYAVAAEVMITDAGFEPPSVTIKTGATVVWAYQVRGPHTVTADDGSFASGPLRGPGNVGAPTTFAPGWYEHVFDRPGTYGYHCAIHPQEKGTIIVE